MKKSSIAYSVISVEATAIAAAPARRAAGVGDCMKGDFSPRYAPIASAGQGWGGLALMRR